MATFDEMYPDVKAGDIVSHGHDELIVASELHPCWHCTRLTRFIEINFEAPLCSSKCISVKDIEYWRAEADLPRRPYDG